MDVSTMQKLNSEISELRKLYAEEKSRTTQLAKRLYPLVNTVEGQLKGLYQNSIIDREDALTSLQKLRGINAECEAEIEITSREVCNLTAMYDMKAARLHELEFTSERQLSEQQESGQREMNSKNQSLVEEKEKLINEIEELRKANQKQAQILQLKARKAEPKTEKEVSPSEKSKVVSNVDDPLVKERTARRQEIQKLQIFLAEEQKRLTDLINAASTEKKKLDTRKKEHESDITKLERQLRIAWVKKVEADNQALRS